MSRSSGKVLRASFAGLARRWLDLEGPALADEPDAVHQMRVTSRRLRALLRLWGAALRVDSIALADDLRWVAHALGDVRDLDVLEERLLADAEEVPLSLASDLIRARLDHERAEARATLAADVASPRFAAVRLGVQGLLDAPVRRSWHDQPTERLVRIARKRARAAVRAFEEAGLSEGRRPSAHQLERLHHARRVAKSARYSSEALAEEGVRRPAAVSGHKGLRTWGESFMAVADALGLVQDSVVAEGYLRRLADGVGSPLQEALTEMADREAARRPEALDASLAAMRVARRLVA